MSVKCDVEGCGEDARLTLTAAYPCDERAIHPEWATYPTPLIRTCPGHLMVQVMRDASAPANTPGYLLKVLR